MDWLPPVLPPAVALAVVATLGYLVGRQQVRSAPNPLAKTPSSDNGAVNGSSDANELEQTRQAVEQLQRVSQQMRLSLAAHHACVQRFNQSIEQLRMDSDAPTLQQLSQEAERILQPTRQLSVDIAHAYDEIRQHALRLGLVPPHHPTPQRVALDANTRVSTGTDARRLR